MLLLKNLNVIGCFGFSEILLQDDHVRRCTQTKYILTDSRCIFSPPMLLLSIILKTLLYGHHFFVLIVLWSFQSHNTTFLYNCTTQNALFFKKPQAVMILYHPGRLSVVESLLGMHRGNIVYICFCFCTFLQQFCSFCVNFVESYL